MICVCSWIWTLPSYCLIALPKQAGNCLQRMYFISDLSLYKITVRNLQHCFFYFIDILSSLEIYRQMYIEELWNFQLSNHDIQYLTYLKNLMDMTSVSIKNRYENEHTYKRSDNRWSYSIILNFLFQCVWSSLSIK